MTALSAYDWEHLSETFSGFLTFAAAHHAIAAGLFFLYRSRTGFPRADWPKTAWSALLFGAAAWCGIPLLVVLIATAIGAEVHGQAEFLIWHATGPVCFTGGAIAGEILLRKTGPAGGGLL